MEKPTSLLQQHPSTLLGWKLSSIPQVLCCFVVPAIANCTIYILDFASNVAVVYRHFQESNVRWAVSTLLIMYVPSLVFFTLTVSYVENWNEQFEKSRVIKWFFARILHLVAFPILGIYRYAKIIFWSIDALFRQGDDQEESLRNAIRPSQIELYLFLQAYLQGLPQAILQLSLLFIENNDNRETDSMQVLCVASSLMIVAITTVSFQRFESQRLLGRLKPWAEELPNDKKAQPENDHQATKQYEVTEKEELKEDGSLELNSDEQSTPYLQPRTVSTVQNTEVISYGESLTSENVSQDLPETSQTMVLQSLNTEEDPYVDPRTLMAKSITQEWTENANATLLFHPPTPSLPPPPPPFIPPAPRKQLEFPTRRIPVKGLEQDELLGKSVSFLTWLFFLTSRIVSLVSCFHFFPWTGVGVCLFHYSITLLLLHKYAKTIPTILLKLSLAFIYCFCLIERKVRFAKVYLIYTVFFFTVTVENISISTMWYLLAEWEGWWYNYAYFVIWGCQIISILCVLTYFFILKPNSKVYYPDN